VLVAAVKAAQWLAYEHQLDPAASPALLVTDSKYLRLLASSGALRHVVAPGGFIDVPHSDFEGHSDEQHMAAFVELGMMARARCLITSESGFSSVARWWGAQQCSLAAADAVKMAEGWLEERRRSGGELLLWERVTEGGGEEAPEERELEQLVNSW
jgi:hypothetical protein